MDITDRMSAAEYRAEYVDKTAPRWQTQRYQWAKDAPAPIALPAFRLESDFQWWLRTQAMAKSWVYYHTASSKRSDGGYLDTHLVRRRVDCMAELKMPGENPTGAQIVWLDALAVAREGIPTHTVCVWYPHMVDAILAYLEAPEQGLPPGLWHHTALL